MNTYNPREVLCTLGSHIVTGYADDSFITIEEKGDGISSKTGCDGEVVRAIDPNRQYTVKIAMLQYSDSNKFLQEQYAKDKENGDGTFPILIKDLKGGLVFSADFAWVQKGPSRAYGKETNNREWTLDTSEGTIAE